jgi:D-aminopeptidase
MGIELCYAGHWNIPALMYTGDVAGCREAEQQFPGIVTAVVKHAESWDKASGMDTAKAHKLIAKKVRQAVRKLEKGGKFTTYRPALPMTVTLKMTSPEAATRYEQRYKARKIDQVTLEDKVDRHCDILKWLTGTGLDMTPEKR